MCVCVCIYIYIFIHTHQAFSQDIFKLLTFSVFDAFFGAKFCCICNISQNYTDLRCLLDIKVLTQQAKRAGAIAAYTHTYKI